MEPAMFTRSFTFFLCFALIMTGSATSAFAISLGDVIRTLETPFQAGDVGENDYRIDDYSANFFQESKIASLDRRQRATGRVEVAFDYNHKQMGRETVPTVKFRWEYEQPTTQEIVSNGETMWVYLPENNQVIQSNIEMVNKANQHDPMTFLTGLGNLSRDFTISWAMPNQDVDGNYVLELQPIRTSSLIRKLIIVVDRYAVDAYLNRGKTGEDFMPEPPAPAVLPNPPIPAEPVDPMQEPEWPIRGGDAFFNEMTGSEGTISDIWFPILSTAVYDPNGNSTLIEFSDVRVNFGVSDLSFDFIIPAGVNVVRPTGKEMGF
jgi:outer membrane lipoprotein carrier protein